MAFTHDHINAFAIVSGDSDFIALVNKLKQYVTNDDWLLWDLDGAGKSGTKVSDIHADDENTVTEKRTPAAGNG